MITLHVYNFAHQLIFANLLSWILHDFVYTGTV